MKLINIKTVLALMLIANIFSISVIAEEIKEVSMSTKKQKVVELLNSIESGDSKPVEYINPNKYIQHNLSVKDGLKGFGEVLALLPKGSAKVEVVRAFEDGDYVFAHTKYNFLDQKLVLIFLDLKMGKL